MSSNDNPVGGAQPATLPQEHDRALRLLIENRLRVLDHRGMLEPQRRHRLPLDV